MNETDEKQMNALLQALDQAGLKGLTLLDVPSTQFVRMNLLLLKGLIQKKGLSGAFISVDRPYQYMAHLLTMHQVQSEQVVFIDALGCFSADSKVSKAKASYLKGPFHIDRLPMTIKEWGGNGHSVNLARCQFIIIDNLSTLLNYNSFSSVELFLRRYIESLSSSTVLTAPLMIDRENCSPLYDSARTLCQSELNLREASPPNSPESMGVIKGPAYGSRCEEG